jgi:hypothetical protein
MSESSRSGLEAGERNIRERAKAERLQCERNHVQYWWVTAYKCNYSAFNGGHRTPSDYSEVTCFEPTCSRRWRTRAAYVERLLGFDPAENKALLEAMEADVALEAG